MRARPRRRGADRVERDPRRRRPRPARTTNGRLGGEQIAQLRRRVAGTEAGLSDTVADMNRATTNVQRAVRARLHDLSEQELTRVSCEVADALFERIHQIARVRAAMNAARD